ncbi:MAG: hypothetical protein ACTSQE_11755 [Candidatus Heimdallarchaeaceae archaeon]
MSPSKRESDLKAGQISVRKRKPAEKSDFVELEEIAYTQLKISKKKIKSGEYLKTFLSQTSSPEEVRKAIKVTIDALLDSIAHDLKSLSSAALVPHPDSKEKSAIVRGPLNKEIVKQILAIFRKYPPVINDLLGSEQEVKVLDTGIGYVVLENCEKDNYLVGIVQEKDDVDELSRRLSHVQQVVLNNSILLEETE